MEQPADPSRKLPAADRAVVELTKVAGYLLNASHPDNGGKARFFEALGFPASEPALLIAALKGLAVSGEVVLQAASAHGRKYVVDGHLESPGGRRPFVRSVWIVDQGQERPRLVTAYPSED
jgi:hypothetical protein